MTAYLIRAVSALIIMSAFAFVLVKYSRRKNSNAKDSRNVEIITSLRLTARDIFFAVRCGPDVIAFTVGSHGTCLLGRWSYDDWKKSQEDS
ncbi:MAG: hypothetical protein IJQ24_00425 [Synergistaceae bacterium]|nr:hypothetical protein [Synergistaceae bacterium]MBR0184468.1 hypothetical protein [Synergistaceae bacterium]